MTRHLPTLPTPGDRLRWAREQLGIRATDVETRFGWNVNTYKSSENNTRGLTRGKALRYAAGLKVPSGWLLTGEGSPYQAVDAQEIAMLVKFRRLTGEHRGVVNNLVDNLLEMQGDGTREPPRKAKVVHYPGDKAKPRTPMNG